jgi:MoxR-like ATPase
MNQKILDIKNEVNKVIVGQNDMIEALIIGLISDGHILLEGVPGLAKTTAVNTLAKALGLVFKRIQFTPDLLPSDLVGTEIYDQTTNEFKVKKGPIFTNLLLADEINRAPAKVQSALLEVMQEKQVTIANDTFKIDKPFLVLATQNPVEQEGTYNLPEAQLDRFMLKVVIDYNTKDEELEIVQKVTSSIKQNIEQIITKEDIDQFKTDIENIHVDKEVVQYMVDIVFATREPQNYGIEEIKDYIQFGASPRGSIDLYKASKARAYINGKDFVTPHDVASVVKSVLRHRIVLSYEGQANDITTDFIIQKVLEVVKIP